MNLEHVPVAKTEMLIRKPVRQVFEAFVDPGITSNFWFSRGSGRLEPGTIVRWDWEMYNFGVDVYVLEMEQDKRILVEWSGAGAPTNLEFVFTARPDNTTFVQIKNSGFAGSGDEMVEQAVGSVEGFTFVLAGLKAYLEHNVRLNLVADRFPDGLGG